MPEMLRLCAWSVLKNSCFMDSPTELVLIWLRVSFSHCVSAAYLVGSDHVFEDPLDLLVVPETLLFLLDLSEDLLVGRAVQAGDSSADVCDARLLELDFVLDLRRFFVFAVDRAADVFGLALQCRDVAFAGVKAVYSSVLRLEASELDLLAASSLMRSR